MKFKFIIFILMFCLISSFASALDYTDNHGQVLNQLDNADARAMGFGGIINYNTQLLSVGYNTSSTPDTCFVYNLTGDGTPLGNYLVKSTTIVGSNFSFASYPLVKGQTYGFYFSKSGSIYNIAYKNPATLPINQNAINWTTGLLNNTGIHLYLARIYLELSITTRNSSSSVSSTFISASPSDLSSLNLFNSPNGTLTLNYNVTNTTSLASVNLFYRSGQNNSCWIFWNQSCQSGTGYNSYNITNTTTYPNYTKVLYDNQVLPGSYTMSESVMESTAHLTYQLTGQARFSRSYFYNLSNNANYGIFENMVVQSSGAQPLSTYYCNSSYSTGSPPLSSNCVLIYDVPVNATYNHTHSGGLSKHILVPLSIVNGKVGTVSATSTAQIVTRGGSTSTWNLSYVNSSNCPSGVSQLSTNTGASWSDLSGGFGCWDQHIHQYYGNDSFCSYVQATMTDGTASNSSVRCDTFDINVLPPNSPAITPITTPTNQPIWINYTNCTTAYGTITYYNISVYSGASLFYSRNNSLNNSYLYTPSMDGTYTTKVTCFDNNSLSSSSTSDPFSYDVTAPVIVLTSPANNSIYNTTNVNMSISMGFNVGELSNCTIAVNNTYTAQIDNTVGVNLYVGFVFPVNTSYRWNVSCIDEITNRGYSVNEVFYVNQTFITPSNYSGVGMSSCPSTNITTAFWIVLLLFICFILYMGMKTPLIGLVGSIGLLFYGIAFAGCVVFGGMIITISSVVFFFYFAFRKH